MSWIEIAKNILSLVVLITTMIKDNQQRGLGRMEATNEALVNAQRDIAYASAVEGQRPLLPPSMKARQVLIGRPNMSLMI